MSELKNLLREAKHNLRDLEHLLQKARSMDENQNDQYILSREELQKYFDEMLKILESLPENLKIEEGFEEREIKSLHLQMEEVRRKVEECFGRVEAACETNLHELSEFIEKLYTPKAAQIQESKLPITVPGPKELLNQSRIHFANEEFETCLKLVNQVLRLDPGSTEAAQFLVQTQKKVDDQRREEELAVHIENLKKEAMDQFDKEQYGDCLRTFKFLCELEPNNRTLRDYLELSRQKVQEMEDGEPGPGEGTAPSPGTNLKESIGLSKSPARTTILPVETVEANFPPIRLSPEGKMSQSAGAPELCAEALPQLTSTDAVRHDSTETETEGSLNELPAQTEQADWAGNRNTRKFVAVVLAMVVLAFFAILGSRTLVKQAPKAELSTFEVQSDPDAARVFIDGELKGQTRLRLESLAQGNHQLRVEMEGYTPLTQPFFLGKGQPTSLSVRLEKLAPPPESKHDPAETAKSLFEQGSFLEASRNCDLILQSDPQNSFAQELKDKIRNYYLHQGASAVSKSRWEEARLAFENALSVSPADREASRELKLVKAKLKKPLLTVDTGEAPQLTNRIRDLHQQISAAISAANYLPPTTGNAFDLIHQLSSIAPADGFAKERLDQVQRELLFQIQRKLQARDFENAKVLIQQVQAHFPEVSELKNLRDGLKAEETKTMEASSLVQKAESSMSTGRYVTPPNDNAFAHASRLLAIDSQNQRALALRKESLTKASAQAKEFIRSEKFDEAREVYSALLQLSSSEGHPPLNASELKRELEKIEFTTYPVVHDHTLMGSCTGRLRVNGYIISFVPSGSSKDGFNAKLPEIETESPNDKLRIQVRNKTYRFESNLAKNKEENRERLEAIYQRLSELKARAQ
jgi:tetratricopeptide (TPR) repeat protein